MVIDRLLLGLLSLLACARVPVHARTEASSQVASAVLATAAESVFVQMPRPASGVLLAGDSATARALAVPARLSRLAIRVAPERVWCAGGAGVDRTEGTRVTMSLDGVSADRAVVHWSVTCLLESAAHPAPFAGGSGGSLVLARRAAVWHVVAAPTAFSY